MQKLIGLACVGVLLASCTTIADIDTTLQKNAPKVCNVIETTHVAFVAAAATGNVKESLVRKEAAAYSIAAPLCADPSNLTTAQLLLLAAQQFAILTAAKDA